MNEADRIWDELESIYSRWGIEEIPFTESASTLGKSRLREVFTGRKNELREVLNLFKGRERKRLLIYGWIGIGKTAFILEILDVLNRNEILPILDRLVQLDLIRRLPNDSATEFAPTPLLLPSQENK